MIKNEMDNCDCHMRKADELIKDNWQITQMEIAFKLGISQQCVGHMIDVLQYWKPWSRRILHSKDDSVKQSSNIHKGNVGETHHS